MITFKTGEQIIELSALTDFLVRHDYDFYPRLSERVNIENYSEKLHSKAVLTIAEDNGSIAGLAAFYANNHSEKKGYLSLISVDKNHRGKGIGRKLMEIMHGYLHKIGFRQILLEVYNQNHTAIQLYKKYGYKEISNGQFISMIKEL